MDIKNSTTDKVLIAFLLAGIATLIVGLIWTRTEYLAYVIRDKAFNWWSVATTGGAVLTIAGTIWAAFKLDQ